MKKKKCEHCGNYFHYKWNYQKYCTQCRPLVYNMLRRKARLKYNKLHPRTKFTTILCNWCGKPFISSNHRKYCSITCKKEARKEQNIRNVQKYRVRWGKSDKQKYFDELGNSNLTEHRNTKSFKDEQRMIRAELRRLHL